MHNIETMWTLIFLFFSKNLKSFPLKNPKPLILILPIQLILILLFLISSSPSVVFQLCSIFIIR